MVVMIALFSYCYKRFGMKFAFFGLLSFSFVGLIFYTVHLRRVIARKYVPGDDSGGNGDDFAASDAILLEEYKKKLLSGGVVPKNINFIFHNKLPKCGSTTINYVLLALAKKNNFNFEKFNVHGAANSIMTDEPVIRHIEAHMKTPYFLLKHQFWVNFSNQPAEMQPTYINIIRDPLEWFTTRYYFNRYGWKRDPGCRGEGCSMSKVDHAMSIDQCVANKVDLCTSPTPYFPYLCGPGTECKLYRSESIYKLTRKRLLDDYFFVGILEHFEETLRVLEKILPQYFDGAVEVWKSEQIQKKQQLTKTMNRKEMSPATREFYLNGPMKYEAKLYDFALNMFKARLSAEGIPLVDKT